MAEPKQNLWRSSAVLTAASFVGALGNYAFQALMGRMLPLSEFGYLSAALGMVGMVTIGVAAASQAVTHHLARHQARDEQQRVGELKAASTVFLLYLTVASSVVALVFIHPISVFFHVPRPAITGWVLACILVGLWSALATAWCAGLGRFHFLAALGVTSVLVRLATGVLGGRVWSVAETGVAASVASALVLVLIVIWRERASLHLRGRVALLWEPEFVRFLVASVAVCAGNYAFLQSDAVVAQRCLPGDALGSYSAAGMLGRAVVALPFPILTVFFTARSGQERSSKATMLQLAAFAALLLVGAVVVAVGREWWCRLLLGKIEPTTVSLMTRFAVAMIPVGLLQAAGLYLLAARKLAPCIVYGVCGIAYGAVLTRWGGDAEALLALILWGASAALAVVGAVALARRGER